MKQFFMTAKKDISVTELMKRNLPDTIVPEALFKSGAVWMNQKRITDSALIIHTNETILVYVDRFQTSQYTLDASHIIEESDDVLVVYKPPLVNVSPDRLSFTNNLTYGVNAYLSAKGITYKASAITRLDKPVQGLVLYPKHKASERQLFYEMRHHHIKKLYSAFVEGTGHVDYLRIKDPLGFKKIAYISETGKQSETIVRKKHSFEKYEEYSVIPITGRQHQIRCHLANRIAPVIGDRDYGSKERERGVALIACGLNFTCNEKRYRIRLPRTSVVLKTVKVEAC